MITLQDYDTSDLADFADTILKGCDTNKDGKVSRKVMIDYIIGPGGLHAPPIGVLQV